MYNPQHLKRWNGEDPAIRCRSNYMGADCSEYFQGPMVTRDSGVLERSNFEVIKADIERIPEPKGWKHDDAPVQVLRFGHWACGWFEVLCVHEDAEPQLRALDEWHKALEDYPVADDEDYSNREWEQASERWEQMSLGDRYDLIVGLADYARPSIFCIRRDCMPDDPAGHVYDYLRRD